MQRIQPNARLIVRVVSISFCTFLCVALTGCAASEKAQFTRHLSTTVEAGPAANNDVIMAFSVDPSVPSSAVARGNRTENRD